MVFPCSLFVPIDRWVLSDWSSCSATCGDGIQTRDLTCKQEISATLTMRVNEAACLNAAPSLPRVRSCNLGACAKWQASEWSKVSRSMIYDLRCGNLNVIVFYEFHTCSVRLPAGKV